MNRHAAVNIPLLASLAGTIIAAALGVRMSIRLDEVGTIGAVKPDWHPRDPAGWANGPVPEMADPGLAPPPGCGQGRLIPATFTLPNPQTQPDSSRTRRYVIYRPVDYFPQRSYPLVVYAASQPISAETISSFARVWGPSADRDRYLVMYPELTGDAARDAADLPAFIAEVKRWWYVTNGPIIIASDPAGQSDDYAMNLVNSLTQPDGAYTYLKAADLAGVQAALSRREDVVRAADRLQAATPPAQTGVHCAGGGAGGMGRAGRRVPLGRHRGTPRAALAARPAGNSGGQARNPQGRPDDQERGRPDVPRGGSPGRAVAGVG